jgi:hypothetical protein
MAGRDL